MVTTTMTQYSVNAIFQDNLDKLLPEYLHYGHDWR